MLFGCSPYITACGRVISHTVVNRWKTGSRSPRVSPHYCFTGGVKFLQGEGSAVIHCMKKYLLYKDATCLCSPCHRLWQGDCTCKQVEKRLKIPQGLSTLLFHWWSEVPSRGGVRSDSLYEKIPALQRCHLSVFSMSQTVAG